MARTRAGLSGRPTCRPGVICPGLSAPQGWPLAAMSAGLPVETLRPCLTLAVDQPCAASAAFQLKGHGRRPSIYREGEPTEGWGNPEGVPRSQTALRRFVFCVGGRSYPPAHVFLSFKYVLNVLECRNVLKYILINILQACQVGNRRGLVCNRRYLVGNRRKPVGNRRAIHRLDNPERVGSVDYTPLATRSAYLVAVLSPSLRLLHTSRGAIYRGGGVAQWALEAHRSHVGKNQQIFERACRTATTRGKRGLLRGHATMNSNSEFGAEIFANCGFVI